MPKAKTRSAAAAIDDADDGGRLGAFWELVGRRPRDSVAILAATLASVAILTNALFMQSGPHPAPIFPNRPAVAPSAVRPDTALRPDNAGRPDTAVLPRPRPEAAQQSAAREAAPAAGKHSDPIADLLASTPRVATVQKVQKVLTEFGYGQIRPSGSMDVQTVAAIEKFERSRKLPITGRISDRLLQELTTMSGQAFD